MGVCQPPTLRSEMTICDDLNVKVKVILRPTVSRPVGPGVKPPSGSVSNFSFSLKFSFDTCGFFLFCSALSDKRTTTSNWSVYQPVLVSHTHLGPNTRFVLLLDSFVLSDERTGLSFTITAGPRERSNSRGFTATDWRFLEPGGPNSHILSQLYPHALPSLFVGYSSPSPSWGLQTQSKLSRITTDGQSASSSWCHAPFEAGEQMLHLFE
jgi:hypothetical protein